jgi:hypothetical protein
VSLQYFVGAHRPHWLALSELPLFVSHNTLRGRKTLPRARTSWALDSGAFTELAKFGRFETSPAEYAAAVRRYASEVGRLEFAAQQDWMCEPEALRRTGLTVEQHQARTIDNYLALRSIAPELPWMPSLQGWSVYDYGRHVEQWEARGVDLASLPRVGVGSICRRTSSTSIMLILNDLAGFDLKLHGFGLKTEGLRIAGGHLASADSMAWSFAARRANREDGHRLAGTKTGEQNKLHAAVAWFEERIAPIVSGGFCTRTGYSNQWAGVAARDSRPVTSILTTRQLSMFSEAA